MASEIVSRHSKYIYDYQGKYKDLCYHILLELLEWPDWYYTAYTGGVAFLPWQLPPNGLKGLVI